MLADIDACTDKNASFDISKVSEPSLYSSSNDEADDTDTIHYTASQMSFHQHMQDQ